MPVISVIIPVYNTERFLRQCLDSLLSQTYKDIQIIAVDDGSTDGSKNILAEYEEKHSSLITIVHQDNAGAACARNKGIEIATGEYLSFIDSDDWVETNFFEELISAAKTTKADIVDCEYWIVNEAGDTSDKVNPLRLNNRLYHLWKRLRVSSLEEEPDWLLVHPACIWNKLYKSTLYHDSGIRFPNLRRHQDFATTPRVMAHARKIVAVRKPLYYYRQRPGSISTTRSDAWKGMFDVLTLLKQDFSGRFDAGLSYLAAARLLTGSSVQAVKNGASDRDLQGMLDFMDREFPSWKGNAYLRTYLGSKNRLILELMKARAFWALRLLVDGKRILGRFLGRST